MRQGTELLAAEVGAICVSRVVAGEKATGAVMLVVGMAREATAVVAVW